MNYNNLLNEMNNFIALNNHDQDSMMDESYDNDFKKNSN
jgi:hypothetical protein